MACILIRKGRKVLSKAPHTLIIGTLCYTIMVYLSQLASIWQWLHGKFEMFISANYLWRGLCAQCFISTVLSTHLLCDTIFKNICTYDTLLRFHWDLKSWNHLISSNMNQIIVILSELWWVSIWLVTRCGMFSLTAPVLPFGFPHARCA